MPGYGRSSEPLNLTKKDAFGNVSTVLFDCRFPAVRQTADAFHEVNEVFLSTLAHPVRLSAPRILKLRQIFLREPLLNWISLVKLTSFGCARTFSHFCGVVAALCSLIEPAALLVQSPFAPRNALHADGKRVVGTEIRSADLVCVLEY
jgi:hypothetical protein